MKKGETIRLDLLGETEARKIVRDYFHRDFSSLKPYAIFCCRDCGTIVLRASLPDVKILNRPNEKPYCTQCKVKRGYLKKAVLE